jgi:RimJ/RimL family protein N-acetyltransferase
MTSAARSALGSLDSVLQPGRKGAWPTVLRRAEDDDREMVRRWRNHPQVRRASIMTHEIGVDEHAAWWDAVSRDPTRWILIYERVGVPSGVVTIAADGPDQGSATWGFYLDTDGLEQRGELLPAWLELERDAISYAFDTLGLQCLGGETLSWNTPVIQLHQRLGFRITRTYSKDVDGVPQEVVWTELRAADRRRP